jgi:NADP-dependent 3-hydroxy acid dehydrogenase YdfG
MVIEPGAVATGLPNHITDTRTKEMAQQLYSGVTVTRRTSPRSSPSVNRPRHLTINEILVRPAGRPGRVVPTAINSTRGAP